MRSHIRLQTTYISQATQLSTANAFAPTSFASFPFPSVVTTQYSALTPPLPTRYTLTSFPAPAFRTASMISLYCPFLSQSTGSNISISASFGAQCPISPANSSIFPVSFSPSQNSIPPIFLPSLGKPPPPPCNIMTTKGAGYVPSSGNPFPLSSHLSATASNGSSASLV